MIYFSSFSISFPSPPKKLATSRLTVLGTEHLIIKHPTLSTGAGVPHSCERSPQANRNLAILWLGLQVGSLWDFHRSPTFDKLTERGNFCIRYFLDRRSFPSSHSYFCSGLNAKSTITDSVHTCIVGDRTQAHERPQSSSQNLFIIF